MRSLHDVISRNVSAYSEEQGDLLNIEYFEKLKDYLVNNEEPIKDYDLGRAISVVDAIGKSAFDLMISFELKK